MYIFCIHLTYQIEGDTQTIGLVYNNIYISIGKTALLVDIQEKVIKNWEIPKYLAF